MCVPLNSLPTTEMSEPKVSDVRGLTNSMQPLGYSIFKWPSWGVALHLYSPSVQCYINEAKMSNANVSLKHSKAAAGQLESPCRSGASVRCLGSS